jgi:hypothetical protein
MLHARLRMHPVTCSSTPTTHATTHTHTHSHSEAPHSHSEAPHAVAHHDGMGGTPAATAAAVVSAGNQQPCNTLLSSSGHLQRTAPRLLKQDTPSFRSLCAALDSRKTTTPIASGQTAKEAGPLSQYNSTTPPAPEAPAHVNSTTCAAPRSDCAPQQNLQCASACRHTTWPSLCTSSSSASLHLLRKDMQHLESMCPFP